MLQKTLQIIFGSRQERDLKRVSPIVTEINALEAETAALSDIELGALSLNFKARLALGESLDEIIPEAFAAVREAGRRSLGLRLHDVQLIAGLALHQGRVAEMKTGEGKTLAAVTALYLNALNGKGVHAVTVNDFLAKRDALWMQPLFALLDMKVDYLGAERDVEERRLAYQADVLYGANNEFGFDYLRDNLVLDPAERVQRGQIFAVVDEADSILIDEARTPLIIAGQTQEDVSLARRADQIIHKLIMLEAPAPKPPLPVFEPGKEEPGFVPGFFYDFDLKESRALLTEAGIHKVEELLGIDNLYKKEHLEYNARISNALKAHLVFQDGKEYLLKGDEVVLIDEFTGHATPGRRYSDGMHQALEAKEGLEVRRESRTLASVSFQNYFRLYEKLAGMTGTADTEAPELHKIYGLEVMLIPTFVPVIRLDQDDRLFRTEREKLQALILDIQERRVLGQPVLVGTLSVEKSEQLSRLLEAAKVPHRVLNARFHEQEAEITENAGRPGAVTIATNMAGRGTDIVLGGFPDFLRRLPAEEGHGEDPEITGFQRAIRAGEYERAGEFCESFARAQHKEQGRAVLEEARAWRVRHEQVKAAGGLCVLGAEHNESRRIDNQLRGRAGRQGDPGVSVFYLSAEDSLLKHFTGPGFLRLMDQVMPEEGAEITSPLISKFTARAQKQLEGRNFDMRKHLLEYDDVLNRQRELFYETRNHVLAQGPAHVTILDEAQEFLRDSLRALCPGNDPDDWDLIGLRSTLEDVFGLKLFLEPVDFRRARRPAAALESQIFGALTSIYETKQALIGPDNFRLLEKSLQLESLDAGWQEHLSTLEALRNNNWTMSLGGLDPLVEFRLEAFRLFEQLLSALRRNLLQLLFRMELELEQELPGTPQAALEPPQAVPGPVKLAQPPATPAPKPRRRRRRRRSRDSKDSSTSRQYAG